MSPYKGEINILYVKFTCGFKVENKLTLKRDIILNYQRGPHLITESLNVKEGGSQGIQKDAMSLALKEEKGVTS